MHGTHVEVRGWRSQSLSNVRFKDDLWPEAQEFVFDLTNCQYQQKPKSQNDHFRVMDGQHKPIDIHLREMRKNLWARNRRKA